ncbi:MAG TPA: sigma-54 dependent transcriptional regulator [Longimicrobiales bacterium]|nr:sigma-54 dependent transcriptional regulator [Longimicrobiales bacterium]
MTSTELEGHSRTGKAGARDGGRVLVVDDDETVRHLLGDVLSEAGYEVDAVEDGQAALETLAELPIDVVLLDLHLPRVSGLNVLAALPSLRTDACFVVMTAFGTIDSAVEAMRLGAYDYVRKPFDEDELLILIGRAFRDLRLRREITRLKTAALEPGRTTMVGRSAAMQRVHRLIQRVAPTRANVLITGETGTGKELVARALHELSDRADRAFVPVNCSALPEGLLESELFGHVKGSFTGAIETRRGLIEEASGGTLFLDEISTLTENIQVKLLRVVQDRRVQRIGGRTSMPVDFRLVVATNVDLEAAVRRGDFREDLYFRLNVFPIDVPPLRERRDDIPLLANHFRIRFAEELGLEPPGLGPETLSRLMAHEWPGNVRELENFIERSVIMYPGERTIPVDLLRPRGTGAGDDLLRTASNEGWTLDQLEREYILAVLDHTRWQQAVAAQILGVNRRTIYRKLKRYREDGLLPDVEPPEAE